MTEAQDEELSSHSFKRKRSKSFLAGEAIAEWLERNRAELKRGPKLNEFSTSAKGRTGKR